MVIILFCWLFLFAVKDLVIARYECKYTNFYL